MDSSLFPLHLDSSLFPLHSSLSFSLRSPLCCVRRSSAASLSLAFPRFPCVPLLPSSPLQSKALLKAEIGSCKVDTYIQKKVTHI